MVYSSEWRSNEKSVLAATQIRLLGCAHFGMTRATGAKYQENSPTFRCRQAVNTFSFMPFSSILSAMTGLLAMIALADHATLASGLAASACTRASLMWRWIRRQSRFASSCSARTEIRLPLR